MHFYVTGTDIVKILVWRFNNAGRQITSPKKFEEGVFSDLRNLKPGIDATLERPRSEFLEFLYKNGCIRTQKKQKVFFWYSVPHDALFCDALDRDLRRETSYYSYSKYMNSFAPPGIMEQSEFVHPEDGPYTPPPGMIIKKKNSVKMATRGKRSPKDNMVRPEYKMPKISQNILGTCQPLDIPNGYCDYNVFNPTDPDPFVSFGAQSAYNFNYSDIGYAEEMNINNIDFVDYNTPKSNKEIDHSYGKLESSYNKPDSSYNKIDNTFNSLKNNYTNAEATYVNPESAYINTEKPYNSHETSYTIPEKNLWNARYI